MIMQSKASRARTLRAALLGSALGLAPILYAVACAQAVDTPTASAGATTSAPFGSANVSEVVVTGDASANARTIKDKRGLSVISDGISANQVGELPEFGLGEALSSIPGASFVLNNGRGEDQFLTIRGLNPDYNSTTIDGLVLPSTEEQVRSLSFDVLPSIVINEADILKTWTVDQPTDAVGGVAALRTRSAFDHPGSYFSGHIDGAYWDDHLIAHGNIPSGQGDLVASQTFGPNNEFGILGLVSYYLRSSATTNTSDTSNSYYPSASIGQNNVFALDQTSPTATSSTLKPTDNLSGYIPIPEVRGIYQYDDTRTRPAAFARFDFNDHHMWHAHLTGAFFEYTLQEDRYYQFANAVGPANLATATTGSFADAQATTQFDNYVIRRMIGYVDTGAGLDFDAKTHLDFSFNYARTHYQQNGDEFVYTQSANTGLAYNYNLAAKPGALFTFANPANYLNPSLYLLKDTAAEIDQSRTKLPQAKLEFSHNFAPTDRGFGVDSGVQYRDLNQLYSFTQVQLNANAATDPTLAQTGALNRGFLPYSNNGLGQILIDSGENTNFVLQHPSYFTRNASDALINTINNYVLDERVVNGYIQADYRNQNFFAVAGVKYEDTKQTVSNYLPNPFGSVTNFTKTFTPQSYARLLPSLNVIYNPITNFTVRGAITQTLARPEYSQLAENSNATVSGATASETVSNPTLKPRESTNFDLSFEYYPKPGALASIALFDKQIKNEIITLTSTQQGVTVPGSTTSVALTTTTPENAGNSKVQGVEFNLVDSTFDFLPGPWLKGLGARANATIISYDAPYIRMSNGTLRHLPQLISSSRGVSNAALFYHYGKFFAEVSYNHTGKMPISFDANNAVNDTYWAAYDVMDAQVRYSVNKNLDFRLQVKNLQDSTTQKVYGPSQGYNSATIEDGRAYYAGLAFRY